MDNSEAEREPDRAWSLHPQLAADTIEVGDLALSRLLASRDANYPWLLLVPRRAGAGEIIDLAASEQGQLTDEIVRTARALKAVTGCDKLNIAAIGNVVPQLHVHVVARRRGDAAWPRPVWGTVPPKDYDRAAFAGFVEAVRREMGLG